MYIYVFVIQDYIFASSQGLSNVFQQCFLVFPSLFQFCEVMVSCSDTGAMAITGGHRTKVQQGYRTLLGTQDQGAAGYMVLLLYLWKEYLGVNSFVPIFEAFRPILRLWYFYERLPAQIQDTIANNRLLCIVCFVYYVTFIRTYLFYFSVFKLVYGKVSFFKCLHICAYFCQWVQHGIN